MTRQEKFLLLYPTAPIDYTGHIATYPYCLDTNWFMSEEYDRSLTMFENKNAYWDKEVDSDN